MTERQSDKFHRNLSTILLTVISIFGISSVALLLNINKQLNSITVEQAVQKEKHNTLTDRVIKIENKIKL